MGMRKTAAAFQRKWRLCLRCSIVCSALLGRWTFRRDPVSQRRDSFLCKCLCCMAVSKSFLTLARDRSTLHDHRNNKITYHKDSGFGNGYDGRRLVVSSNPPKAPTKSELEKWTPRRGDHNPHGKILDFVNKPREVPSVLCNSSVDEMYPTMPLADRNSVDVMPGSCTFPDQHLDPGHWN